MTQENKIKYLRIASGICGYGFKNDQLDLLVSLYELIIEKQGEGTLHDIVDVEEAAKKRADIKSRQDLLDKVSEKAGSTQDSIDHDRDKK